MKYLTILLFLQFSSSILTRHLRNSKSNRHRRLEGEETLNENKKVNEQRDEEENADGNIDTNEGNINEEGQDIQPDNNDEQNGAGINDDNENQGDEVANLRQEVNQLKDKIEEMSQKLAHIADRLDAKGPSEANRTSEKNLNSDNMAAGTNQFGSMYNPFMALGHGLDPYSFGNPNYPSNKQKSEGGKENSRYSINQKYSNMPMNQIDTIFPFSIYPFV